MSDRFDHRLEHTLDTKPGGGGDDAVTPARGPSSITGAGRRRQWSEDDKLRIVVESLRPGVNVSEVARRNGLSPQQLFGWRREARALMAEEVEGCNAPASEQARSGSPRKSKAAAIAPTDPSPAFASVVIAAPVPAPPPLPPSSPASGRIEIAIGDAVVRVIGSPEPAQLVAVLRALRRAT